MKTYQYKIMAGFVIVLIAVWGTRSYLNKYLPPKMGFKADQLITADNKTNITINDYKGQVVIVSCYQTWCGDCAKETVALNQLATIINSDKFKVLYITDEEEDKVKIFRERFLSDKILFTHSKNKLASMGIHVYPTTFLLSKKNEVIKTKLENYDWLQEEVTIRKLLAE